MVDRLRSPDTAIKYKRKALTSWMVRKTGNSNIPADVPNKYSSVSFLIQGVFHLTSVLSL